MRTVLMQRDSSGLFGTFSSKYAMNLRIWPACLIQTGVSGSLVRGTEDPKTGERVASPMLDAFSTSIS